MLQTFEATLQPMLMLFICIAIGFALVLVQMGGAL